MNFLKNIRLWQWLAVLGLIGLSAGVWYYLYTENLTLVYNDAKSYLNISRAVVDSQQPGLAQIGSVWLPLVHVLKLPFIWIEWMWHSGLAGSIISMAAYVVTVVGIAMITARLTRSRLAAAIAGLVAALNVNFLYMQSTPLTEPLFLALLTWSAFFLVAYIQTSNLKHLLPLAALVALQCMTRYDGWFIAVIVTLILLVHELRYARLELQKALGHVLMFATPVAFACLLWFGWNAVIFGDPLYFISGPGSAHAQQAIIDQTDGLITKGSFVDSFKAYGFAAAHNIGWWILGASLVGWIVYTFRAKKKEYRVLFAVMAALLAIFVFNVISLILGFSSINVPELNWSNSTTVEPLFNVRYGLLMLPLAALGVGLLVAKWRLAAILVVGLVAAQGVVMLQDKPITLRDGTEGASAFVQYKLAKELAIRVEPNDTVLMSMSVFNPLAFESNLQLRQLIHAGVRHHWQGALDYPEGSAKWIVMGSSESDPVYQALHGKPVLHEKYRQVYSDDHGAIYERIEEPTLANN